MKKRIIKDDGDLIIEKNIQSNQEDLINAEKCPSHIKAFLSHYQRLNFAKQYGSNWASIISGCGDQ